MLLKDVSKCCAAGRSARKDHDRSREDAVAFSYGQLGL
jgi:hypothetical protein